jgi:bacterioferritin
MGRAAQVEGIKLCEAQGDFVSRQILAEILADTENHIDFLENQLGLIRLMGEQNYIQSAMKEIAPGD